MATESEMEDGLKIMLVKVLGRADLFANEHGVHLNSQKIRDMLKTIALEQYLSGLSAATEIIKTNGDATKVANQFDRVVRKVATSIGCVREGDADPSKN